MTMHPVKRLIPRPVVICGPSGTGKTSLINKLLEEFRDYFDLSVSHTTRSPREGEVNGVSYHFTTVDDMVAAIKNGEFLEYTSFAGNYYGTSKKAVESISNQGKICILDVEIEGVKSLKKTDLNPRFVFIKPPSMAELEQRLRSRGTEKEDKILKRLAKAREELAYGETPGHFDITIVNDDLETTYTQLKDYLLPAVEEIRKSHDGENGLIDP